MIRQLRLMSYCRQGLGEGVEDRGCLGDWGNYKKAIFLFLFKKTVELLKANYAEIEVKQRQSGPAAVGTRYRVGLGTPLGKRG